MYFKVKSFGEAMANIKRCSFLPHSVLINWLIDWLVSSAANTCIDIIGSNRVTCL